MSEFQRREYFEIVEIFSGWSQVKREVEYVNVSIDLVYLLNLSWTLSCAFEH